MQRKRKFDDYKDDDSEDNYLDRESGEENIDDDDDDLDNELLSLGGAKKKLKTTKKQYTEEDFEDGYESDLMKDDEEREDMENLNEFEKEEILFERAKKREALQRNRKRAIEKGELIAGMRREGLKEANEKKKTSKRQAALSVIAEKRNRPKKSKEKSPTKGSESDDNDDEDYEEVLEKPRTERRNKREVPSITLNDINKVVLPRRRLLRWVAQPYFEDTSIGCFARVTIGESTQGGHTYRLVKIENVLKCSNPYVVEDIRIHKKLTCSHGSSKKDFKLMKLSNSRVTESEFNKWVQQMHEDDLPLPTIEFINDKVKQMQDLSNFKYDDDAINRMIQDNPNSLNNLADLDKRKIQKEAELEDYRKLNDLEKIKELEIELEDIKLKIHKLKTTSTPTTKTYMKVKPKSKLALSKETLLRAQNDNKKKKKGKDPFSRTSTASTYFSFARKKPESPKTPKTPIDEKNPLSPLLSPFSTLAEAHNFDLDIDLDLHNDIGSENKKNESSKEEHIFSSYPTISVPSNLEDANLANKRIITLRDYRKRREMI